MKTNELTGTALDWVVAKCEYPHLVYGETIGIHHASNQIVIPEFDEPECYYSPSTNWAQGGPIIEREKITVTHHETKGWSAWCGYGTAIGKTPLIAGMRCYVANKLGDEVEIPEGL